jgi:hypothetical protein
MNMVRTTRQQREALARVYHRGPVLDDQGRPLSYREFRKTVQGGFFCDPCIMVHWRGMWLGIELDGYTHS